MKRGQKTGPEIEARVCQYARDYPGWSQQRIVDEIFTSHHVKMHRSTVATILERNQIRNRYSRNQTTVEEEPDQAERSHHWPGLRAVARKMAEELEVPLPRLLGFQWFDAPNIVIKSPIGKFEFLLNREDKSILAALRQHLPGHPAWKLERSWLDLIGQLAEVLDDLSRTVKAHVSLTECTKYKQVKILG